MCACAVDAVLPCRTRVAAEEAIAVVAVKVRASATAARRIHSGRSRTHCPARAAIGGVVIKVRADAAAALRPHCPPRRTIFPASSAIVGVAVKVRASAAAAPRQYSLTFVPARAAIVNVSLKVLTIAAQRVLRSTKRLSGRTRPRIQIEAFSAVTNVAGRAVDAQPRVRRV